MCINELIKRAWDTPNTRYWFVSPTFDQAKIQYRRLVGMFSSCSDVFLKCNMTELRVKFINQSEIVFKSGEVAQNLRGETLHGVILDEVRELPEELWSMIIRPMLTTTQGWAAFVSTPAGYDGFYDLFCQARDDKSGNWFHMQAPSTANPLFTDSEFEMARKEMGEAEFAQEILAQFRDLQAGSVYMNFSKVNLSKYCPWLPEGELYTPQRQVGIGMDFNLDPMVFSLMQAKGSDFYVFDTIYLKRSHTQEAAKELIGRLQRLDMQAKPQVTLIGDATGKAGQRAAAGKSDYTIVCQALDEARISWSNETPDSNPAIKDRINTVNAKLKSADGSAHLWMHPENCKQLVRDFERVTWKKGSANLILDQTKDPSLTHASDGVGYYICGKDPMRAAGGVGKLLVIRR